MQDRVLICLFKKRRPASENDETHLRKLCSPVREAISQIRKFILSNIEIQICFVLGWSYLTVCYSWNKYFMLNKRSTWKLSSPEVICKTVLFGFKFKQPFFSLFPSWKMSIGYDKDLHSWSFLDIQSFLKDKYFMQCLNFSTLFMLSLWECMAKFLMRFEINVVNWRS